MAKIANQDVDEKKAKLKSLEKDVEKNKADAEKAAQDASELGKEKPKSSTEAEDPKAAKSKEVLDGIKKEEEAKEKAEEEKEKNGEKNRGIKASEEREAVYRMNWTQAEEERLRLEAEKNAKLQAEWEKKWANIKEGAKGKTDEDYIGELPNHHFEANHKYDYVRMQMGA